MSYSTVAKHLSKDEIVNLGSFYTSKDYIRIVWEFIKPFITDETVIFDPACGYGYFLQEQTKATKIGNDIDREAISIARARVKDAVFFNRNALKYFDRQHYGIGKEKLIIIGNPPYNDLTSQAKKSKKNLKFEVDINLKARDIGISFLRMFYFMKADYVCVLHPLSFLIKRANFSLLKGFKENYRLIKNLIISSRAFANTSKISEFPIIIALYERDIRGMSYNYIKGLPFKTIEGPTFRLSDFEYIGNLINKYPSRKIKPRKGDLMFYTLRDINALKRNKTFLHKPNNNAIKIKLDKLDFYIYVDVFKDFIDFVPYYFGNLDIPINVALFEIYKRFFISYALKKHDFLRKYYNQKIYYQNDKAMIFEYFKKLFGEHFNENNRLR